MSEESGRPLPDGFAEAAQAWALANIGPDAVVSGVVRMPGHSGITVTFAIAHAEVLEEVVMRVPPPGVRRAANLDVVRLAPVLQLVGRAGVPVPTVRSWSEDEQWFGTPFLMVSRVAGEPLPDVFEPDQAYPTRDEVDKIFRQSMEALARIHAVDATPLLESDWAAPQSRAADIAQWRPLLLKSEVPAEVEQTTRLGELLLERAPADVRPRIVHGDFYSNNWMLDDGRLTGILDWENSTLNDPGWDLGWFAALYDPACWDAARSDWMTWHPTVEECLSWYEAASGRPIQHPEWYQALMCYRLAAITPAKVRLHRTGRHVDPIWELFASSVPLMIERGFELLGTR